MKFRLLIISCLLLTWGCGNKQEKQAQETQQKKPKGNPNEIAFTPQQMKNGGVDTGRLPKHKLSSAITVNGQVDVPPQNLISVNVPLGGFLKRTNMLPGEEVRKGDILAWIENQDYVTMQQEYLSAKSRLVFLEQEQARQKELSSQQASPLKMYQQTVSEYKSVAAQTSALAQKLGLIGISVKNLSSATIQAEVPVRSPIHGFVSKVGVNVGRYVNPTDVLMELVDTDDIHAALTVFEQDIPRIKIGTPVTLSLPSMPDKTYPGKVILIGRMLDSNRSVVVHCHFLKSDRNLLPNMFLQGKIQAMPKEVSALPDDALVSFENKTYAYTARKNGGKTMFELIPVKTGTKEDGWNEVTFDKPVSPQEIFVLKGAFSLLSAMKNTGEEE